jgi:hypothetical protein
MRPPSFDFANDDREVRERLLDAAGAAAATGVEALHDDRLADIGLGDDQASTSRSWLFSALAMALSSVFLTCRRCACARTRDRQRLVDLLAADQRGDQVQLLRADAERAENRLGLVVLEPAFGAFGLPMLLPLRLLVAPWP